MTQQILDALAAKYNAQKLEAFANLQNYFNNPAGIGEHPNIVEECDKLVSQVAEASGKLETLKSMVSNTANESSDNRK